jgi:hypothetical protein
MIDARRCFFGSSGLLVLLAGLLLPAAGLAESEAALVKSYAVGSRMQETPFEDQHGESHLLDTKMGAVLFARDMDGGEIIKQALADSGAELMAGAGAVNVADVSGMPWLIRRLFVLPKLRKRSYRMLLDLDGSKSARFPGEAGKGTLIRLDALRIVSIEHYGQSAALAAALARSPEADREEEEE